MLDPASTRPLVDPLGDRIAERIGDLSNRHPLHVMGPVNRGDPTHFPGPRRPVDSGRLRGRQLLLIRPWTRFAILTAKLDLPLDDLGFPPGDLGFPEAELGQLLGKR